MGLVYAAVLAHSRIRALCGAALLVGILACGTGCDDRPIAGTVRIVGSTTLLPMMSTAAGAFAATHPRVEFDEEMRGTADGIALLCEGLAPVAGASRAITPREADACAAAGIRIGRLHVADDAVVLFTGRNGDAACLTGDDIYGAIGPESTGVDGWSAAAEIAGGTLSDGGLHVVGPGAASGTRQFLVDAVIAERAERRGQPATLRPDYEAPADEQLVPERVAAVPGALGFAGLATASVRRDDLRFLAIDLGGGCVEPTPDAIRAGAYPLSRPLYLYVDIDAVVADPAVSAFVDAVLSPDGLASATTSGGLALSPDQATRVRTHWDQLQETVASG